MTKKDESIKFDKGGTFSHPTREEMDGIVMGVGGTDQINLKPAGTVKRYLLFAGENYYPGGGWDDYVTDADTVEELRDLLKRMGDSDDSSHDWDWWQIIDIEEGKVVDVKTGDDRTKETFEPLGRWWAIHHGFIEE